MKAAIEDLIYFKDNLGEALFNLSESTGLITHHLTIIVINDHSEVLISYRLLG